MKKNSCVRFILGICPIIPGCFLYYTIFILVIAGFFAIPSIASAYVGPGAGFAVMTSFFALFVSFFLALLSMLFLPLRLIHRLWKNRKNKGKRIARRIVIIGFDGMDSELTRMWMDEGKLPNLENLRQDGTFMPLQTTCPAVSPVAWSSFATGTNPGKHNIFDFLTRNPENYLPVLSSAEILPAEKSFSIGGYDIPIGKPKIRFLRKSKSFWKILGEQGVFSSVIRLPITFPPEKFFGVMLSGMCVPDLHGTQGSFTYFTSILGSIQEKTAGRIIKVVPENGGYSGSIPGPPHPFRKGHPQLAVPVTFQKIDCDNVVIKMYNKKYRVKRGELTDWLPLAFRLGMGMTVDGIARFFISGIEPHFRAYMSPINIDPLKPVMPISYPHVFSTYLAHQQGKYATLGLAEDTWALNEGVLGEGAFLEQSWKYYDERRKMFWSSFKSVRNGVIVCVFDTTDRIQHMFMRHLDPLHPGHPAKPSEIGERAIEECYKKMDEFVGEVLNSIDENTVVLIISDHGFKSFRHGFHVNAWLCREGYLSRDPNKADGEWFTAVDWLQTKAYAAGLTGLYVNQKGRERQGTVSPGDEKERLLNELKEKLLAVRDYANSEPVFSNVYKSSEIYKGPYKINAPDLIFGYNAGYRSSWDSVVGKIEGGIIEDNMKSWSGDHCMDSPSVPGILFMNRKLNRQTAHITDLAPTVLTIFGITVPPHMDGSSML